MIKNKIKTVLSLVAVSAMIVGCGEAPKILKVKKTIIKKEKPKISKTVNVTGAAGELKRLTYGGLEELVDDISEDGHWLLMDTYSIDTNSKIRSNTIIQKLNVETKQKMILTPENSSNYRASWSENEDTFIFVTNRSGKTNIVESMGANGENGIRFITTGSLGRASSPNYNDINDEITFTLNGSVAIIKRDGSQVRMYSSGQVPKFSHDGKKVLFTRGDGNFRHIYLMNKNGTSLMQLTNEQADDYEAVFSPTDKKIAFISNRANKHKHLFVMDVNGQNLIQLTDGNYDVSSLVWGDDGYIYFSANAGGNRDIWRLRLN